MTNRPRLKGCAVALALLGAALPGCVGDTATPHEPTGHPMPDRESIRELAARYRFSVPSKTGDPMILTRKDGTLTFGANSRKCLYNGVLVWLNAPTMKQDDGSWAVAAVDIEATLDAILEPKASVRAAPPVVVIDPGHGGDDTGAKYAAKDLVEKQLVLHIAKRVCRALLDAGVKAQLTRKRDRTLSLAARTRAAKNANADLFVSIHMNSAGNDQAEGLETYVLPAAGYAATAGGANAPASPGNGHDRASMTLAYFVHKELLAGLKSPDRGIRRARFSVLRRAPCPAILIECGFLSHAEEGKKFATSEHRNRAADSIVRGIQAYLKTARDPRPESESTTATSSPPAAPGRKPLSPSQPRP